VLLPSRIDPSIEQGFGGVAARKRTTSERD
jgi:hypothetical protein